MLGGFGFILFQIYQFFFSIGGSRSRIAKDKRELKELAQELSDNLVPITKDELSLLSSKLQSSRVTKGMYYTEKGLLSSVYEEPMISYGYRNYGRGKSVLVANTAEGNFEFEERSSGVVLKINGFVQGTILDTGVLTDAQGKKIADINFKPNSEYRDIKIRERKVAELLDPENEAITENTRAFLELKDLDEQEQNILLGLTIYDTLIRE